MRTRTHTKSAGTDAAADFMGQVSRRNEELQFFDSTTVKVEQTTRGVRWHTKVTPSTRVPSRWQTPKKELDPGTAVTKGTWVYISPQNTLVTTGLTDLASGVMTTSIPGIWEAAKDVPASAMVGGVMKYNVPQVPLPGATGAPSGSPLAGDFDGDNVFWLPISPAAACY